LAYDNAVGRAAHANEKRDIADNPSLFSGVRPLPRVNLAALCHWARFFLSQPMPTTLTAFDIAIIVAVTLIVLVMFAA